MSDVYLDDSKAIVRWHERIWQWSEFVSEAVAGRVVPGERKTDTRVIKDALEDDTACNEIYAAAVAESASQPATDEILGKVWAAYQGFLNAAWAFADSGERGRTSPFRAEFDAAYGKLLDSFQALFPRLPRLAAPKPAEPTGVATPWPGVGYLDWRDIATLLLMKNPGMKVSAIAALFDKHPGNLSRYEPFKTVVALQKDAATGAIKSGMKTKGKDGSVGLEAIDTSGDPADMDWDSD